MSSKTIGTVSNQQVIEDFCQKGMHCMETIEEERDGNYGHLEDKHDPHSDEVIVGIGVEQCKYCGKKQRYQLICSRYHPEQVFKCNTIF